MKKYSKLMALLLAVTIVLPGIAQAAPISEATEKSNNGIRIAGKDRIETSVEASKEAFKDKKSENVVLAGYSGEVDALTGTILAHSKSAPLILIKQDRVPDVVKAELKRLDTKNIYILGGEKAVSEKVKAELEKSYTVKRISGSNREETAVAVAKEVKGQTEHVFLAKGYDILADTLAIGPVSAIRDIPVFLTNTDKIAQSTLKAMKDLGVKEVTIIGGNKAITSKVENQLKGYKINRISDSNREKTALKIAGTFFTDSKNAVVASGYIYPDALVGGYIGAMKSAPILLVNQNSITDYTKTFLKDKIDFSYVLGGTKVISEKVYNQIRGIEEPSEDDFNLPNRTLRYLEKGEDVKNVQIALKKLGYNIAIDGSYGPGMRAAILDFQEKHPSLVNNGIYGPNTRTEMIKALKGIGNEDNNDNKAKIETRGLIFDIGKSSDQVKLLKDFFRARKETNIPENYMYDTRTVELVRNYQKEKGLKVDGIAGDGTMGAMNKEINDKNYKISLTVPNINNKGDLIMINKSSNTLYFITNGVIKASYPIATGKSRTSLTPDGQFKIVVKYKNPSWGGAGIYPPIAGGDPTNPLGTRWIGISLRGGGVYGVHGNSDPGSIGEYVSLGCVRMFNKDVENLYERVKIDTPIWLGNEGMLESFGVQFK